MTVDTLDPLIHVPTRLQIVAMLAALPDGDALSFTRLQEMIGLTPGNLITHLRKLEEAGYLVTETNGNGRASRTSIALTRPASIASTVSVTGAGVRYASGRSIRSAGPPAAKPTMTRTGRFG